MLLLFTMSPVRLPEKMSQRGYVENQSTTTQTARVLSLIENRGILVPTGSQVSKIRLAGE